MAIPYQAIVHISDDLSALKTHMIISNKNFNQIMIFSF